jgi:hypothetical protein
MLALVSDAEFRPDPAKENGNSPVGGMLNAGGRSFSGSARVTVSARRRYFKAAEGRNATAGFQLPRASKREEACSCMAGDRLAAVV